MWNRAASLPASAAGAAILPFRGWHGLPLPVTATMSSSNAASKPCWVESKTELSIRDPDPPITKDGMHYRRPACLPGIEGDVGPHRFRHVTATLSTVTPSPASSNLPLDNPPVASSILTSKLRWAEQRGSGREPRKQTTTQRGSRREPRKQPSERNEETTTLASAGGRGSIIIVIVLLCVLVHEDGNTNNNSCCSDTLHCYVREQSTAARVLLPYKNRRHMESRETI